MSGLQLAAKFHPIFGPILMVTYACLSNTLLLTGMILVYGTVAKGLTTSSSPRLCKIV